MKWFRRYPARPAIREPSTYKEQEEPLTLTYREQEALKRSIRKRLGDSKCRIPRPKLRYRLRTCYSFLLNSWVWK